MVSPYQHGDRVCSCRIEECFYKMRGETFKNFVTSSTVRQWGVWTRRSGRATSVSDISRGQHFGLFDVGGIGAGIAVDDGILSRFGKHHELVR